MLQEGLSNSTVASLGVQERLEELAGTTFNSCLLNFYRSGLDHMGYHSDNEPLYGTQPIIGMFRCHDKMTGVYAWRSLHVFVSVEAHCVYGYMYCRVCVIWSSQGLCAALKCRRRSEVQLPAGQW